jgi:hypothetical protein
VAAALGLLCDGSSDSTTSTTVSTVWMLHLDVMSNASGVLDIHVLPSGGQVAYLPAVGAVCLGVLVVLAGI